MRTFLTLRHEYDEPPPGDAETDVRTPRTAVERFLREFSDPGDVVFDPFAGF